MCDEKRSWFGVIDMTGGDPKTRYSFNPSAIQWWAWLFGKAVAIVIGLWLGVSWVAGSVFEDSLQEFHQIARPQFEVMMDDKIEAHGRIHVDLERIHEIEKHNAKVDEKLVNMEKKLEDMDDKLDILIRNGG